jgi:hypothetical protein
MLNIATIYYFGELGPLLRTIKSLNKQRGCNFHVWFVLANASNAELIWLEEKCEFNYSTIVNADVGLYNAMNIALDHIKDGLVYFLNGGDEAYASDSLAIINQKSSTSCCNWFSTIQTFKHDVYLRRAELADNGSYLPAHQGFVIERNLISECRFDENLRIASDHYFMSELDSRYGTIMHSELVANMELGGISNRPSFETVSIRWQTQGLRRGLLEVFKFCLRLLLADKIYYRIIFKKGRISDHKR